MSKALSDLDFDIIYDTVGYEMEIFSGVKDKPKFISIVRGPSKFTMRFHADNLVIIAFPIKTSFIASDSYT